MENRKFDDILFDTILQDCDVYESISFLVPTETPFVTSHDSLMVYNEHGDPRYSLEVKCSMDEDVRDMTAKILVDEHSKVYELAEEIKRYCEYLGMKEVEIIRTTA